jgi:hypothetical protein
LARGFRFYGKKRGHRRTGSPLLGSLGEAAFFGALVVIGCASLGLLFNTFVVPDWRVNHEFVETTCKVLDTQIAEMPCEDGPLFRPEIKIQYEAAGGEHHGWHYDIHRAFSNGRANAQAALDRFEPYAANQKTYPCWYDPTDPNVVVLVRDYRWWVWLVFTVPGSFVVIGAGGLLYTLLRWGRSAERRAALTQRVQESDLFGGNACDERLFPFVPPGADMTNSPGTRLKFRLPMVTSPGWALFGALSLCVVVNGIVSVLAIVAIRGHMAGRPDWAWTLFTILFALLGLGTIVVFVRKLLVTTGIGPTLVEISEHPLQPGGQYHLFLSQSGRLTVNTLRAAVICEETVTYRQGTNARTESRAVFQEELFRRENFEIGGGAPCEIEFELSLPAGLMHSFKAGHNEINWSLVVEGEVIGWPDFKRSFPLVVRPAQGGASR